MSIRRWVVAGIFATAMVSAPAAQATPSPSPVPGNPKCPSGTTSVKFESPSAGTHAQGGISLTLADKKTVSGFDLPGTDPYNATVIVKGGPGANVYLFTGVNEVTGTRLVSPDNRGGNLPDISHVQFCLKSGEQPPGGGNPPPPCGGEHNPCPPPPCGSEHNPCTPPPCPEGTHPSPDGKVCIQPAPPANTVTVVINSTTNTVVNVNNATTNKTVVNQCKCKTKSRRCPAKKKAKKKCPPLKHIKFRLDGPSVVGPSRTAPARFRVRGATSYIQKAVFSVNGVQKHVDWRGPSFTYNTIAKRLRGKEYVFGRKRVEAKLYLKCRGLRTAVNVMLNIDP